MAGFFLGKIGLAILFYAGIELFILNIKFNNIISGLEWIGLILGVSSGLLFRLIKESKKKQNLFKNTLVPSWEINWLKIDEKTLGKEHKFKKDFTAEQYAAYLERKAKDPEALISEDAEPGDNKFKSKKKAA